MRLFKTYMNLVFSLVALLVSIQFCFVIKKMSILYENSANKNYSLVIVANSPLQSNDFADIVGISEIKKFDIKPNLERFKSIIDESIVSELLKRGESLNIYQVNLNYFPNNDELNHIKKSLLDTNKIKKIETFSKYHNVVYNFIGFLKIIVYIFTLIVLILGCIMFVQQMKIWLYEHRESIEVMDLLGASYFFKSAKLHGMAIIGSIFAATIATAFFIYLPDFEFVKNYTNAIGISIPKESFVWLWLELFGISVIFSIVAVAMVMMKAKFESN